MAKAKKRWVVKAGSQMVCEGGPLLIRSWMQQVRELRRSHSIEVVWVTSGAIASAMDRTGFNKRNRKLSEKQALSAIGQPLVMDLYNLALQATGLLGAQILLTYGDLSDAGRRKNFQNTVETLLSWDVTPILNENDAVATEEIRFGDNDSLSAKVARVVSADQLVILSDVQGLFSADPKKDPKARLIEKLARVDQSALARVSPSSGSARGTGGMFSKLQAAREASKKGIPTSLVRGDVSQILLQIAQGQPVGTRIGLQS